MALSEKPVCIRARKERNEYIETIWRLVLSWICMIMLGLFTLTGVIHVAQITVTPVDIIVGVITNTWWCAPGAVITAYNIRNLHKQLNW